jgi:hypothetical protein
MQVLNGVGENVIATQTRARVLLSRDFANFVEAIARTPEASGMTCG